MMQLTKNFKLSEFDCNDGTPVPENLIPNVRRLARNLQVLRDHTGRKITINSGYRTAAYNKAKDGKPASLHLSASAGDIVVEGLSPSQVANTIEQLILEKKMEQGGLGTYKTFTHYDVRGKKARW